MCVYMQVINFHPDTCLVPRRCFRQRLGCVTACVCIYIYACVCVMCVYMQVINFHPDTCLVPRRCFRQRLGCVTACVCVCMRVCICCRNVHVPACMRTFVCFTNVHVFIKKTFSGGGIEKCRHGEFSGSLRTYIHIRTCVYMYSTITLCMYVCMY
jgi:hypothetical protein